MIRPFSGIKKIKRVLIHLGIYLRFFRIENSIIIFSEARGGSTWLMELLSKMPKTIVNWEPLHLDYGVVPLSYNFGWRPHLPITNNEPKYKALFDGIFKMRLFNTWTTKYVKVAHVYSSKYVLTKFVRANQCLPWVVNRFTEFKHPPILLMRHPIATCISRMIAFNELKVEDAVSKKVTGRFVSPNGIHNERFLSNESYINTLETSLEVEIALWCINNAELITHKDREKWITLYYENLVLHPEKSFEKLLSKLNVVAFNHFNIGHIEYKKPSTSSYLDNFKPQSTRQIESYFDHLNKDSLLRIQSIFDHFGLEVYSAFSPYPKN